MLVIPGRYGKDTCDGFSRRAILRVGSSALAGLSLPTLLRNAAHANDASEEEAPSVASTASGPENGNSNGQL